MERSADGRIHTTEWEDVQYKFGNRVGKYATHELQILAQKLADQNQNATLQPYDADEERVRQRRERHGREDEAEPQSSPESRDDDERQDDDDDELLRLRQQRLQALQALQQRCRFGLLRPIEGSEYVTEVTDASAEAWVVAVLVKPGDSNCEILLNILRAVAQRHRDVKFVSLIASDVIANFPDKHVPCVLLYKDRTLVQQISGLEAWRSRKEVTAQSVEMILREQGVLPRESDA